mmetsp:Transcript_29090/g.76901  ORF Transcript_29090/g.76901 Transcript_29090/m.76901 type:complete len:139 (-) Transcript_29090:544-960(-)
MNSMAASAAKAFGRRLARASPLRGGGHSFAAPGAAPPASHGQRRSFVEAAKASAAKDEVSQVSRARPEGAPPPPPLPRALEAKSGDGLTLNEAFNVRDTGAPLKESVGGPTLGRILNILGEPIDELGPIETYTSADYL